MNINKSLIRVARAAKSGAIAAMVTPAAMARAKAGTDTDRAGMHACPDAAIANTGSGFDVELTA